MRTYLFYLTVIAVCVFYSSCHPCKDKEVYYFPEEMETYFGVFKPNNYWVYENTTHTKRDSLYISDYREGLGSLGICTLAESRHFQTNSSFILKENGTDNFGVRYEANIGHYGCLFEFQHKDNYSPLNFLFLDKLIADDIGGELLILDTVAISVNGTIYDNVIVCPRTVNNNTDEYCFAPSVGIVKIVSLTDTFNLSHYKIL